MSYFLARPISLRLCLLTNLRNSEFRKLCSSKLRYNGTAASGSTAGGDGAPQKLSLYGKFKVMFKDYWYVLIPVHVVTSVGWFGTFYQVSKSGVDVGGYMKKLGISETVVDKVTRSGAGHIAIAWACYKVASPLRYAVTVGGATVAINSLRNLGYIKPAKEIYSKGKDKLQSLKDMGKQGPKA